MSDPAGPSDVSRRLTGNGNDTHWGGHGHIAFTQRLVGAAHHRVREHLHAGDYTLALRN